MSSRFEQNSGRRQLHESTAWHELEPILLTNEEYFGFAHEFQEHHALFYTMWGMGKPFFTKSIPTAAVGFDHEGQLIRFLFNPDFWNECNEYERRFIIAHECLHVIFNHGFRTLDAEDGDLANKALDIVVNHTLVNRFGFDRKKISFQKKLCWTDTLWKENIPPNNMNFEYYYNKLKKDLPSDLGIAFLVDDHSGLGDSAEDLKDIVDAVGEVLSDFDKESIADVMGKHFQDEENESKSRSAGTESGGWWVLANVGKVVPKKKWETVIRKWSKKFDRSDLHDQEQWARINRRFVGIDSGLMLPTEMEIDREIEGRILVWFFQDTSGSCAHLKDRFFKAALTLPKNRFDVKMHCFDTQVFETTLESRELKGFGGTSFSALETYVQNYIQRHNLEYPKAIFVLTDGYGDRITPEFPKNWYWFLDPYHTSCIPSTCNLFRLEDYE